MSTTTRKRRKVILQPAINDRGFCTILRPGAFFSVEGRLYVGYGWLSSFHADEKPVWDPEPVPLNGIVETCHGFYHFSKLLSEGPPYFRKYVQLTHVYNKPPGDWSRDLFVKKGADRGVVPVREQVVLPSGTYLEYQWGGGFGGSEELLNRKYVGDWRAFERFIRKQPSLKPNRESSESQGIHKEICAQYDHGHGTEILRRRKY